MRWTRPRVALLVVFVALASVGAAAAISGNPYADETGAYHGCVGQSSLLRVLTPHESCRNNEVAIDWNRSGPAGQKGDRGPQGLQGPKGDTGATGPAGPVGPRGETGQAGATGNAGAAGRDGRDGTGHAYLADACGSSSFCPAATGNNSIDLVSLELPAGTYVLMGSMGDLIFSLSGALVQCNLVDPTNAVLATGQRWREVAAGENNERHLLGAVTLSSTGTVKIQCAFIEGGTGNAARISKGRLVAIRVDGVN